MKTNILPIKRHWSWKVFLVLFGLNNLALVALKYYRFLQQGENGAIDWTSIIVMNIEYIACIFVGLFLANRIGLGLPFVEGWAKRQPVSMSFRKVVSIAWILGIAVGVLLLFISIVVFEPSMQAMFKELGIQSTNAGEISPLSGLLASFYAGITEETLCRLGGLTLIAWLGGLLFHDTEGRPKPAIMWLANILLALVFGFGHLQTASGLGWPMSPMVVARGLLLNGIAGLAFGWLYWKYGLESAILAHFFADIIVQVAYPFTIMWQGEITKTAVFIGVATALLLTLFWAVRFLATTSRNASPGEVFKTA